MNQLRHITECTVCIMNHAQYVGTYVMMKKNKNLSDQEGALYSIHKSQYDEVVCTMLAHTYRHARMLCLPGLVELLNHIINNQHLINLIQLLLQDSTNCPLIQASKAKIRANPVGAASLSTRTPNRAKTITLADVACGNSIVEPTRSIKARSARARPPMKHGGDHCR